MLLSRVFDLIYSYRKLIGGGIEIVCRLIYIVYSFKGVRDIYLIRYFICFDRYFLFLLGILFFLYGSEVVFGDVVLFFFIIVME